MREMATRRKKQEPAAEVTCRVALRSKAGAERSGLQLSNQQSAPLSRGACSRPSAHEIAVGTVPAALAAKLSSQTAQRYSKAATTVRKTWAALVRAAHAFKAGKTPARLFKSVSSAIRSLDTNTMRSRRRSLCSFS